LKLHDLGHISPTSLDQVLYRLKDGKRSRTQLLRIDDSVTRGKTDNFSRFKKEAYSGPLKGFDEDSVHFYIVIREAI